jgi:hypothetical protein
MSRAYDIFQKLAEHNKQLYTLLRFACRCDHTAALTRSSESAFTFLAAKNKQIEIFNFDEKPFDMEKLDSIANENNLQFSVKTAFEEYTGSDLLYIDTFAEGNIKAMELTNYGLKANKFIIMPKTSRFAHNPEPHINIPLEKKIGTIFGINHFLMANDDWFILEHDDADPGMTVLVNRKNVSNA